MAQLRAKLKRVVEPNTTFPNNSDLVVRILDLTQPINGNTISRSFILMDYTVIFFKSSAVSYSGAIRCTNSFWYDNDDGYGAIQNANEGWGAVAQQDSGSPSINCRLWPCCTLLQMDFPRIHVSSNFYGGEVLGPGELIRENTAPWDSAGVEFINLRLGTTFEGGGGRFYVSCDIQIYGEDV